MPDRTAHASCLTLKPLVLIAAVVLVVAAGVAFVRGDSNGPKPSASASADNSLNSLSVAAAGWKTDFHKHSVPLGEFSSGGPPRDGIAPIDDPKFVGIAAGGRFLSPREPVVAVAAGNKARAYPLQILTWHEIVNDSFGGRPIGVTFCPLCNSSVVFDRRVDGRTLRFGTTGNLRNSDLVMWDDATQSWWQQLTGEAVVGKLTGTKLRLLDSQILSWKDFAARYPGGQVLSKDTGFDRPYGTNPYAGYDDVNSPPFALDKGKLDDRLPPKLRVSAVTVGRQTIVFPFDRLAKQGVMQGETSGKPVVVFFKPGLVSALDRSKVAAGKDVGTAAAFDRRLAGRTLDFRRAGNSGYRDTQTGSLWDITGRARSGPLAGRQLDPVRHDEQFWFAIAAFYPRARIVAG